MKQRKISVLLKSYFYFTKQERKGIYPLLALILFFILWPELYARVYGDLQAKAELSAIRDSALNAISAIEVQSVHSKNHYRNFPVDSIHKKPKLNYPIDLNSADSNAIVALYRIGPGLTHRIIEYRNQLGGFVSLNQLKEIWGFDEDILFDLKGKISINTRHVKYYKLNVVSLEELQSHPYFKYKLSRTIINYRNQHGPFNQLSDLKKIPIIDDSIYSRITNYLVD